jgi:DNA primase
MHQRQINFQAINHSLLPQLDSLLTAWLPDGYREGKEYVALNPLRQDHAPGSFRINRITGRWGDFAMGDHGGDIISLYAYLNRISQWEAAKALSSPSANHAPVMTKSSRVMRFDTTRIIQKIWGETLPAKGTLVEVYFASRGYNGEISETLRFHPGLFHAPSKTTWPAMVAAIMQWPNKELIGIHRTWLARDGRTKASVQPKKMMLGIAAGGAVRLGKTGNPLIIGEGIETSISVQGATGFG